MDTKALRQKILDLAIRGKLVPQDPNDEPASVLLERIRAEKQQMVKDGKLKAKDIKNDTVIFKGDDNLHYEQFADGTVKCIEDEIPFDIPDGWCWCRLSMVGFTNIGLTYKPSDIINDGTIVLRSCNIRNGKIDLDDLVRVQSDIRDNQYIKKNDILICARNGSRALVGKCAIMDDIGEKVSFGAFMAVFRSICYRYIYHYFNTALFRSSFDNDDSKQINQVTQSILRDTMIPLPPFTEQRHITDTLDNMFNYVELVDAKVKNVENLIENTKSKILDLAIRGKLVPQDLNDEPASVLLERIRAEKEELIKQGKIKRDKKESVIFKGDDNSYYEKIGNTITCIDDEIPYEIPENWCWCRLDVIGDWKSGATPSRKNPNFYNGNIPWIKTGDLNDGYITNIPETISQIALQETSVKMIPTNTVLIAMYGATIGKVGITTCEATTNQACCACCNPTIVTEKYLFYFLLSQKNYFENIAVGGAQPNISKEKIIATMIPVPPINEQNNIVIRIEVLLKSLKNI